MSKQREGEKVTHRRSSRQPRSNRALITLVFVAVLAVTALSVSGLAQRQTRDIKGSKQMGVTETSVIAAPATSVAAPVVTVAPSTESGDLLFTVPVGPNGVHDPYRLADFGAAEDGSFWIGDGDDRLLHYASDGNLLSTVSIEVSKPPMNNGLAVVGTDLWLSSGPMDFDYLRKLSQDGKILAEYRVPSTTGEGSNLEPTEKGVSGVILGGNGEVLFEKHYASPYVQLLDAGGNFKPTVLSGYPANNKLYTAKPDGRPVDGLHTGHVKAGDLDVTVEVSGTLADLRLLKALSDGSFYIIADEWVQSGQQAEFIGSNRYLLCYSSSGQLLKQGRVPPDGVQIAAGGDNTFYTLAPQLDEGGKFNRVEVRRIILFGAHTPLPPLPTPTITPILPTATVAPPTDTPTIAPTPVQDLAMLAQQSDLIVRAKTTSGDGQTHTLRYGLKPEEWIKNPDSLITDKLVVWVLSGRDWHRPIPVVLQADFTGQDDESMSKEYILFLHKAGNTPVSTETTYWLTDEYINGNKVKFSNAGVFSIEDGKIGFAGIGKYGGWPVDKFVEEIHKYAPTPVPVSKSDRDLSLLGRNALMIAEVEWQRKPPKEAPESISTSAPTVEAAGTGKNKPLLQVVAVKNWITGGIDWPYIGLYLTPDEYNYLAGGSGHYILFLRAPNFTSACSDSLTLLGYYQLQEGLNGVFEMKGNKIGYSGTSGYEGYTVDEFLKALGRLAPTPIPSPTTHLDYPPPTFADWLQRATMVAKVEFSGQEEAPGQEITGTFHVQEWFKKPEGYTMDSIHVRLSSWDLCRFSPGRGPYIIVFNLDKNSARDDPEHGVYYIETGGWSVFDISEGVVQYGSYIGRPAESLESDIRAMLAASTATPFRK